MGGATIGISRLSVGIYTHSVTEEVRISWEEVDRHSGPPKLLNPRREKHTSFSLVLSELILYLPKIHFTYICGYKHWRWPCMTKHSIQTYYVTI